MSAFNNNNNNLNNTSAGQANRVSHPDNQLNENHGIAATGLNDPILGGSISGQQQGLNYSGAPISDAQKVNQQESYGHTAGHDLNSNTNRTGGTGIPPVNTAAHVQQNAAQEALGSGHNTHHAGTGTGHAAATSADAARQAAATATGATGLTGRNVDPVSTGQHHNNLTGTGHRDDPTNIGHHTSTTGHHNTATGHHDPTSATGHHGATGTHSATGAHGAHGATGATGLTGATGAHGVTGATGTHGATNTDPVAHGATHGTHPSGAGLGVGLPGKDQKHVGDQRFNDKHGNLDHHNETSNAEKKPTAGEKIKGNLEKITGKITGNEAKVIEGENLAQGRKL